jgi:hypothetical protein
MKVKEFTVSKKLVYVIGLVIFATLLILAVRYPLSKLGQSPNTSTDASNLIEGSPEKFAFLSGESGERSIGST